MRREVEGIKSEVTSLWKLNHLTGWRMIGNGIRTWKSTMGTIECSEFRIPSSPSH